MKKSTPCSPTKMLKMYCAGTWTAEESAAVPRKPNTQPSPKSSERTMAIKRWRQTRRRVSAEDFFLLTAFRMREYMMNRKTIQLKI